MLIVVYVFTRQKNQGACSGVFFSFFCFGCFWTPNLLNGTSQRQPQPNPHREGINARHQRHFTLIFGKSAVSPKVQISTKTKKEHTLSLSETHARARELREREREKNKAHGEKLSFAFLFTVVFVGFTRGGGGRARRRPCLSFSN